MELGLACNVLSKLGASLPAAPWRLEAPRCLGVSSRCLCAPASSLLGGAWALTPGSDLLSPRPRPGFSISQSRPYTAHIYFVRLFSENLPAPQKIGVHLKSWLMERLEVQGYLVQYKPLVGTKSNFVPTTLPLYPPGLKQTHSLWAHSTPVREPWQDWLHVVTMAAQGDHLSIRRRFRKWVGRAAGLTLQKQQ